MYTHVHPCTLMYTHVHSCTPMYTHVHPCTLMYTNVHSCTPMYTHEHQCTLMYTHVHSGCTWLINLTQDSCQNECWISDVSCAVATLAMIKILTATNVQLAATTNYE